MYKSHVLTRSDKSFASVYIKAPQQMICYVKNAVHNKRGFTFFFLFLSGYVYFFFLILCIQCFLRNSYHSICIFLRNYISKFTAWVDLAGRRRLYFLFFCSAPVPPSFIFAAQSSFSGLFPVQKKRPCADSGSGRYASEQGAVL